jgi:Apea-like HEPN
MKPEFKVAILVHLLDWHSTKKRLPLGNGVYFCESRSLPVWRLYEKACAEDNLDHGEPYLYNTCILIYDWESVIYSGGFPRDPYSFVNQLINVLAIYYGTAIDMVRIFTSADNFKTYHTTEEVDYAGPQIEFLVANRISLTDQDFKVIRKIWNNVRELWNVQLSKSRVINAMTHFYYSWNVHYLEQTAVHISIVLEILFSPHSKDELTHQIAFNVCQFIETGKSEKLETYKKIKKYYGVRSKIVHGERINEKDEEAIPEFFKIVGVLLVKIISSPKLVGWFNDNEKRKVYLEKLIFE